MNGADSVETPLSVAAASGGTEVTEAFELLSNETRLAILLGMWEAYDPYAAENSLPFSALRERVGIQDSGQFNYHLGKLEGMYVSKTESGYSLRPEGLKLVGTVIASTGRGNTLEPSEIDVRCFLCEAPTAIMYQDGWLYQVCTECEGGLGGLPGNPPGALFGEPFPPAAIGDRTPEEIFAAGVFRLLQVLEMKRGLLCPRCSGVVNQTVEVCEPHEGDRGDPCQACGYTTAARVNWVCTVCKYRGGSSPASTMIGHPAVVAFYEDHGIDVWFDSNDFDGAKEVLGRLRSHQNEIISSDPLRIQAIVTLGDDELRLTLDENLSVLSISEQTTDSD